MDLSYGFVAWICHMGLWYGLVVVACRVDLSCGFVVWVCRKAYTLIIFHSEIV